jgi:hypothetical protein
MQIFSFLMELEFLVRPHLKVGEVFEEGVAEESVLM